ncbi:MAG: hypothetical protein AB1791_13990 [Chloroflexota bacterium]
MSDMVLSHHLTVDALKQFVAGRLGPGASESVLSHLAECEQCLAAADQLWAKQPVQRVMAAKVELEPEAANRVHQKLVNHIHLADLNVTALRLGTVGFWRVALGILRPLMRSSRRKK